MNLFISEQSTIWRNTDDVFKQYIFDTVLFLLLMLAHSYNIIIYYADGPPDHGIYDIDVLNHRR